MPSASAARVVRPRLCRNKAATRSQGNTLGKARKSQSRSGPLPARQQKAVPSDSPPRELGSHLQLGHSALVIYLLRKSVKPSLSARGCPARAWRGESGPAPASFGALHQFRARNRTSETETKAIGLEPSRKRSAKLTKCSAAHNPVQKGRSRIFPSKELAAGAPRFGALRPFHGYSSPKTLTRIQSRQAAAARTGSISAAMSRSRAGRSLRAPFNARRLNGARSSRLPWRGRAG